MPTPEEIALGRIHAAAESGATELNLSHLGLRALPPEIGMLTHLARIDLRRNQLSTLPPEIGNLTQLTTLDLSRNQLSTLPPEIGNLTRLTKLYLWGNQLTALPPEIGVLTQLTKLNLAHNQLSTLPPEIGALTQLTKLDLTLNQLSTLPPEIGNLTRLTRLHLSDNALSTLLPEIKNLTQLTELDLSNNELSTLPPEIGALTQLTKLNLARNHLSTLPPEIGNLTQLTDLDLSGNELSTLPPEIGALTQLTKLDLARNQLSTLPPEIGNLTHLTRLHLWGNQLTALPPEIWTLTQLTELDLSSNEISTLPPEIGALTQLTKLNLARNQLSTLPPEIERLNNLAILNLHGNPLTLALPRTLLEEKIDRHIRSLLSDAQAILRFYRSVWEEGQPLGEARVLFVGQPAVGKTSLVHRLKDGSYDPNRSTTLTVERHDLPLGAHTAHLWDFGGQDFMHATHPLFFSARCVYVLVLNVRQSYEQNRVEYWLRTIRAYGGDSPVIIVGNQADVQGHVLDLPQNRLRRQFPNIVAFLQTSAQENSGIEELRATLAQAVDDLPHVRVLFARSHLQVKAALEAEKQQRDIIPYERYRDLCARQGISDEEDQHTLLLLLHDLGVVLDFSDEAGEPLSPEGVLNPNWVTNAAYRLITDQEVRGPAAGQLTADMTRRILSDYQPWHRDLILKLLEKFELAYPAHKDGLWYLPNAMPQDEPAAAGSPEWDQALTFEYIYPELPESVITRFIVRVHQMIDKGQVWRWGVILRWNANRALVRASVGDKRIEIRVIGAGNTRRDLLALIRGHFSVIHQTFAASAGEETFPIQKFICPPQYPGLRLDYDELLILEGSHHATVDKVWRGKPIILNLAEVLNGFVAPEVRREERERRFPDVAREIHYHEHRHLEIKGNVSGSTLNLGDENTISQQVQGSFNTPANPELGPLLAQLTQAVEAMLPHLSADQAEEVRDDLERLQEELQKEKPRRKWYSVSIEGLIQAAENVEAVGEPVLRLAKKILGLLSP